jgi:hypothetical protein
MRASAVSPEQNQQLELWKLSDIFIFFIKTSLDRPNSLVNPSDLKYFISALFEVFKPEPNSVLNEEFAHNSIESRENRSCMMLEIMELMAVFCVSAKIRELNKSKIDALTDPAFINDTASMSTNSQPYPVESLTNLYKHIKD